MFTLCKVVWEKNKTSKLIMLMGPIIILTVSLLETIGNKGKVDSIYNASELFIYQQIIFFWMLIITEFSRETSIFSMPVRKKDIIKEYYICSLIYFVFYTFINMCVRIVVFKLYNANAVQFERLSILGIQEFLFLTLTVLIILPLIILYKNWGMILAAVLFYIEHRIKIISVDYVWLIVKNNLLISIGLTMLLSYISYKIVLLLFNKKPCV
ncbi:hypothetical protein SAMN02745163_00828 [Clostridium cavendishii DSM 21758]|uniref:Uncharacterized protein n=1 Tax=Clostridium cavendishii DSM 21758 TaxID=1121302 RepID=A0A1M6EDM6_9CLOT|nr:hypothetical protein [Clostridium cavendishii]SHI83582.1 hypothetical protein SAMN02745163_00828 [Clostridium cavendishii DSM 21758]